MYLVEQPDPSEAFTVERWYTGLLNNALARAFAPIPEKHIWDWADEVVWLENEDAAEPGPYRSAKTPGTRRLQELHREPYQWYFDFDADKWVKVQVGYIIVQKSSQSGYSEACLNVIRWLAHFRPCNVIYAIDTAEEAKKIARRLGRSLQHLDPGIFTGDPDDLKTFEMCLRGMEVLFYGSFSEGKFANKQAPRTFADEVEEYGLKGILDDLDSRKKTASSGLQTALSKPKLENGPINRAWKRGNREELMVACPHCQALQPFTFSSEEYDSPYSDVIDEIRDEQSGAIIARMPHPLPRGQTRRIKTGHVVFHHCKDLLGAWDELRILRETYYECAHCQGRIEESSKHTLVAAGQWMPTAIGTPGVVSQHINDLYSSDLASSWGRIALEYLAARREGRNKLQKFHNHRLGNAFSLDKSKFGKADIRDNIAGRTIYRIESPDESGQWKRQIFDQLPAAESASAALKARGHDVPILPSFCPPYHRGMIPFAPAGFLLGSDVGGNYAKWAVGAIMPNLEDIAIIDWGVELDPNAIAEIMLSHTWPCMYGSAVRLGGGFLDAKFRKTDSWRACMAVPGRALMPCAGIGGATARSVRLFAETHMPSIAVGFKRLDFNDREAKDEMYLYSLKEKVRRIFFPIDVENDPEFIAELTAEEIIEKEDGSTQWNEHPGANHYGDCVKLIKVGLRFITIRTVLPKPDLTSSLG